MKPRVIIIESHLIMSSSRSEDHVDFRYFETVNCPDQDQWMHLLHDLSSRLCDSGLGSVLFDLESSGDSAVNQPSTGDQLVELRNLNYGRPLLNDWVRDNHLQVLRPIIPCRWQAYACDEYFADGWWDPARYDPEDYLEVMEVMLDYTRIYEVPEHEFLAVASPGFDRTGIGFRKQHKGIWAFYPGEDRFEFKTPNLAALREGWINNTVTFKAFLLSCNSDCNVIQLASVVLKLILNSCAQEYPAVVESEIVIGSGLNCLVRSISFLN